jgi:hypothetical protein
MVVNWRYKIAVRSPDCQRAREILRVDESGHFADYEALSVPDTAELPAEEHGSDKKVERRDSHPAEGFVEIGFQSGADASLIRELSLKENLIPFRSVVADDGVRKFFVRREDESRAREILREIEDGTPRM